MKYRNVIYGVQIGHLMMGHDNESFDRFGRITNLVALAMDILP